MVVGFTVVTVVVGFFENRFLHTIPNTKNNFHAKFSKQKQTIETFAFL